MNRHRWSQATTLLMCLAAPLPQASMDHAMHHGAEMKDHVMIYNDAGMVMNQNTSTLPMDCKQISRDHAFTIRAGVAYANDFPGTIFGMSSHVLHADPCSRISITFINEDQVRHQWMLHGLPKYLYDQGMFTLETEPGQTQTGTFIVPGDNNTYLVHCDLPQHMEKGMKGQLVVGTGSGNLWSIPGVSSEFRQDDYFRGDLTAFFVYILTAGIVSSLMGLVLIARQRRK